MGLTLLHILYLGYSPHGSHAAPGNGSGTYHGTTHHMDGTFKMHSNSNWILEDPWNPPKSTIKKSPDFCGSFKSTGTFSSQGEKIRLQTWKAGILPNWPHWKNIGQPMRFQSMAAMAFFHHLFRVSDLFGAHCFGHTNQGWWLVSEVLCFAWNTRGCQ